MKQLARALSFAVAAASLAIATSANAAFLIQYRTTSGGSFTSCTDNAGCDLSSESLSILVNSLDADWTAESSTSTSSSTSIPVSNSLQFAGNATSNANDYFEIWLTQTNISTPINTPFLLTAALGISGMPSTVDGLESFRYTAWWAAGNGTFGTTTQILNQTFNALNDATTASVVGSDPGGVFSITQRFIFSNALGSVFPNQLAVTGTITVVPVPAPGVLALFGIGVLGLGLARRKSV
jgi:hypothetical protein